MPYTQSSVETSIFDAARTLLSNIGEAFTMEQLEAKAGISRATIYRRVGTKEMLLKRLAEARGATFEKPDVRLSILKAVRTILAREGLSATTMEQIAEEANVGVATVYRHFGDKDRLIRTFIDEMTPKTTVRALALHSTEDVAADLEKIVGAILSFFYPNRDLFRLVFMGSETERRYLESLRERSDSSLGRLTSYFQSQLDAGRLNAAGEPSELALALMGMVLAFAVFGPLHYGTALTDPERTGKLIVNLFLDDLRGD